MLRRNARLRKEYLFRKALEERESATFDKKRRLTEALENNKAIPTEIRGEFKKLKRTLDLSDDRTKEQPSSIDDEYAYMGFKDPRVLITTSRDPSSRLTSFLKELRLLFPGSQRVNRGAYVVKDLVNLARSNEITDIVLVHEHRGEPDGLIISHLPYGPTAYFGLRDVVLRHDLPNKLGTVSEAAPHLIFENFQTKLGRRVMTILQSLFPPAAPLGTRTITFVNHRDSIHFRHHTWKKEKKRTGPDGEPVGREEIELTECGPRLTMTLYKVELGSLDMKDVKTEWVLRPHFNRQRDALA